MENPNILIIMTDQQAWNAVGYSGNKEIDTPHLDKLASEGVNFNQAVTPCPVCVPARTSIFTGKLTETTDVRKNEDIENKDCDHLTFDQALVKKGYKSEYYGKYHGPKNMAEIYMNPTIEGMTMAEQVVEWEALYVKNLKNKLEKRPLEKGETYETTFYGGHIPYKLDPLDQKYIQVNEGEEIEKHKSQADVHGILDLSAEHNITAIQGRQTIDALERLKDHPFILTCSFHYPHVPITPVEPYASMYRKTDLTLPVSLTDERSNSPYNSAEKITAYQKKEKIQDMTANYYALVTEIDDWVGQILDKLEELKLKENTLVIFISDHGELLGAHGMRGKFNFYEESVRVPFVIRYPGKIKPAQTINTPVSSLNIFPTVLEYAGVKDITCDGYSLKGLMEGSNNPKYDFAVSEWQWENPNVPSIMIRTEDWKLMTTHRDGGKDVEVLID